MFVLLTHHLAAAAPVQEGWRRTSVYMHGQKKRGTLKQYSHDNWDTKIHVNTVSKIHLQIYKHIFLCAESTTPLNAALPPTTPRWQAFGFLSLSEH